ncbi:MAG TPA: hypothetical protein PLA96_13400, partial [Candidatus Brocadia sapporoensis]|nr:hypothetical protein [Candidatus Brocadia sapporoensis]
YLVFIDTRITQFPNRTVLANSLNEGVGAILDLLQVPDHYVEFKILMCPSIVPPIEGYFKSLGLCDTVGSPLEGFVRLEAGAEE